MVLAVVKEPPLYWTRLIVGFHLFHSHGTAWRIVQLPSVLLSRWVDPPNQRRRLVPIHERGDFFLFCMQWATKRRRRAASAKTTASGRPRVSQFNHIVLGNQKIKETESHFEWAHWNLNEPPSPREWPTINARYANQRRNLRILGRSVHEIRIFERPMTDN